MRKKKENLIFERLEILGAGAKGKSIAKAPNGKVIFIGNAVPGDIADIQTNKMKKSFYEGTAVKFHEYSNKRVEPVCEHFGTCGGCKWQFMGYEHQLFYKQEEVENNLKRIGKIELPPITPILGSPDIYFYRNKMEFSFSDRRWLTLDEIKSNGEIEDKNALGFHIPGMWDKILDIKK
ncbi:MAG: TRAM domain-containing protein, partial [Flavobacteriaceae bacterium]|nr:TRAM domain-containing protein [Flavobacteriaceae bacterium]